MRTLAFLLSAVLFGQTGYASVVTTQLSSVNVSSFTSNNLAFPGGAGPPAATLPATVAISSTVTPGKPPIIGVGTSSSTVRTADAFNGLDVNTFTWTVTTIGTTVDVIRFSLTPILPLSTAFRFVQDPPVVAPAGWTRLVLNDYEISFLSTTGEKAPGTFAFVFLVDARDAVASPAGPFDTGSFTVGMTAHNPEPGSLALCGLASMVAGGLGWRRRKSASVIADELPPLEI